MTFVKAGVVYAVRVAFDDRSAMGGEVMGEYNEPWQVYERIDNHDGHPQRFGIDHSLWPTFVRPDPISPEGYLNRGMADRIVLAINILAGIPSAVLEAESKSTAVILALCVLRGDHTAARGLADLLMEEVGMYSAPIAAGDICVVATHGHGNHPHLRGYMLKVDFVDAVLVRYYCPETDSMCHIELKYLLRVGRNPLYGKVASE